MMRKLLLITGLFLMASIAGNAQRKRAFMVGISHYDTALTGYQWNNINGVEDINLLSPILKKQGFYLTTLLDEKATYQNITRQLSTFTKQTKKGDIVYLHFSTHGQPVEDLNGDEEDGWDEAIIPIDAYKLYKKGTYEGKKHLIDDQLNQYVKKLREKIGPNGFLYVVIDACHAGTSSRANDETVRGTKVGFTYNNKVFKPSAQKKSHYRIEASAKISHVMYLEACRPDQVNMEIKVKDKRYGPLSYNIAQALQTKPISTNANEFLNNVKASIMSGGFWPNNQNMVTETSF
ncbi:MAG: caspase family protein [Prevotella sp.]|nr:caspase family protein [Prevotella sp.]